MSPAIDNQTKNQVVKEWLSGNSRDEIAANNGVGAGTVSNVIGEFRSSLDDSNYESIRELAVQLKKEGMNFAQLACVFRRHNYVNKLGTNEEEVESSQLCGTQTRQ